MRSFIYSALEKFSLYFTQRKDVVRVLAYHTIPDEKKFEAQLQFLKFQYNVIDIQQLQDFLFSSKDLPENPLLITFDDGDISVLEKGLPLLCKYGLPSISFIITGLVDTSHSFWCRWIELAFEAEGKTYKEARRTVRHFKQVPNKERLQFLATLPEMKGRQLSKGDLYKMLEKKMNIGNHTHNHPMLNLCNVKEITQELVASKQKFQEWQIEGFEVFAYPNGNWDQTTEEILVKNGIKMAFLFDHQVNHGKINPMRISRIMVDTDMELNEFRVKVSGMHSFLRNFKIKFSV